MKKTRGKILGLLLVLAVVVSFGVSESQAATIGFNEYGTGNTADFQDVDHWVYRTDVGLALDFNPFAPSLQNIEFILQGRVSSFALDANPVIFPGVSLLDNEITFVTRFTETVTSVTNYNDPVTGHAMVKADFLSGDLNGGANIFEMFQDTQATGTQADPTGVSGYDDGNSILSASMIIQQSSFTLDTVTEIGTGSFDIKLDVTGYDSNYFDLPFDDLFFQLVSTGTLNQPATIFPTVMWDGTNIADMAAAGRNPQLFKVDGSTDPAVVPEPSTIMLLGIGLLGMGLVARKRRS